MKQKPDSNGGI